MRRRFAGWRTGASGPSNPRWPISRRMFIASAASRHTSALVSNLPEGSLVRSRSVLNSAWNCSCVPWPAYSAMRSWAPRCAGRLVLQPSSSYWATRSCWPRRSMVRSTSRSTRRRGCSMPGTTSVSSHSATRLPGRGDCHSPASSCPARPAASVPRGLHLMSQSTCGNPGALHASMARMSLAESKPASMRSSSGAFGPAALRRWAIGTMRSTLNSVCAAECWVPGRNASSKQKPCSPR